MKHPDSLAQVKRGPFGSYQITLNGVRYTARKNSLGNWLLIVHGQKSHPLRALIRKRLREILMEIYALDREKQFLLDYNLVSITPERKAA